MKKILEVKGATKKFSGLMANSDITFDVFEGEVLGIVGPNGAGKTTLFNSLSGVHSLTQGSIIFDGVDITQKSSHEICKLGLGRTFQIPQSIDELTVTENVLVAALCHKNMEEANLFVKEIIDDCEIAKISNIAAKNLNVAQKKRLEIARALATMPKILLLDETMAGLTAIERAESLKLIRKINKRGITILTIEHNMDVVMNISDRVVVLTVGKVLTVGSPTEVINNPEVINAYLGGKYVRS
jgi:branched-chain amino acid transport system ATP-binding protein